MKELYFTPQTIDTRALEMRQAAWGKARRDRFRWTPDHSALLVLDMQTYFLDSSSHAFIPSAGTILPRLSGLAGACTAFSLPVIYTRHVNTPENAGLMATWWHDLILDTSPLSQIAPEFDLSHARVLEKSQYDAFHHTNLEALLRSLGIHQVVIGGVMTHLCCESTARAAFGHGFEVFFLVDGTASYNAVYHQASLLNLAHGFAELVLVGEILASLLEAHPHA